MENFFNTIVSIFDKIIDTVFLAFDYILSFGNFALNLIDIFPPEIKTFLIPLISISLAVFVYKFVR